MIKGIYIEIPEEDNEYINSLAKQKRNISKVSIIRLLLRAIRGMDKNCTIAVFDNRNIRLIENFDTIIDAAKSYESFSFTADYDSGVVKAVGSNQRILGRGVKNV